MNQEIQPETGVLKNVFGEDPNQNGGLPVMSEETIANAQAPDPDQTLYTLLDNGEYQPQMDVIYPPGTKFYYKQADGTYVDANIEIGPDVVGGKILWVGGGVKCCQARVCRQRSRVFERQLLLHYGKEAGTE